MYVKSIEPSRVQSFTYLKERDSNRFWKAIPDIFSHFPLYSDTVIPQLSTATFADSVGLSGNMVQILIPLETVPCSYISVVGWNSYTC